jgi:alpha-beta hydrolase superfamily lysophospholipase
MPFDSQRVHISPSGAALNLYSRRADGPALGVVQINHGLAEHAARYARFADFLASEGFHTYAHDHRGHGHTTAPDAPPRIFSTEGDGAAKVLADVEAVHDLIADEQSGLPVIVFGHSMGGQIALDFVLRRPERVRAAAIWNANFSAGFLGRLAQAILAYERFRLGSDMPSRLLPRLTFEAWAKAVPDRRTDFDWLSRDPGEVDKYVADPLCGWDASVSMWRDVFDLIFIGANDGNFAGVPKDMPFHLIGGDEDPATDGGKAVLHLAGRMRRMGFSGLFSKIWPETRHESLNELNRDAIMQQFSVWAKRPFENGVAV